MRQKANDALGKIVHELGTVGLSAAATRGSYNKILAGDLPAYKLSEMLTSASAGDYPGNWLPDKPGTRHEYSSFGSGVMGAV